MRTTCHLPLRSGLSLPAVCFFLLLCIPSRAGAQQAENLQVQVPPEGVVQEIVLTDGSRLYGRVEEAGDPVRFRLLSGDVIELRRERIRSLRPAQGRLVNGEFWTQDPNGTRLFFGPTARPLRKGGGYLAAYELFMPFVAVGLTDRFILAGGTPLFFGEEGPFQVGWLAPKLVIYHRQETSAAVGALSFFAQGEAESAGLLYAVFTTGGPDRALTAGIAYGYFGDELADSPVFMLGGESRISRGLKLITEDYLFPGGNVLASIGPRFFGERLSADLALGVPLFGEGFVAFPIINFCWTW